MKGKVIKVQDTEKTWTSPQGNVLSIYNIEIEADNKVYQGGTMSGKFKEGEEAEFTAEPDKYSEGRYKIKFVDSNRPQGGATNYPKKSAYKPDNKNAAFATSYAKDVVVALINAKQLAIDNDEAIAKKLRFYAKEFSDIIKLHENGAA